MSEDLTPAERTLLSHLQALEAMLKAKGKGALGKEPRGRVSARVEEARAALKAERAKVEAVIRERRKRKSD